MSVTEPQPLPRGRHNLGVGAVRDSQQQRITTALVSEVAKRGYPATTVGQIVETARVSRETFYALYVDKDACYAAAREAIVGRRLTELPLDLAAVGTAVERLRLALRELLEAVANNPTAAVCFLLERPHSASRPTPEETTAELQPLVELFPQADPFARSAAAAMLREVIAEHVGAGRTAELPGLATPIATLIARMLERPVST